MFQIGSRVTFGIFNTLCDVCEKDTVSQTGMLRDSALRAFSVCLEGLRSSSLFLMYTHISRVLQYFIFAFHVISQQELTFYENRAC